MTAPREFFKEKQMKELIKGGKAEGKDCEEIAEKHKVPIEDIINQKDKGIKIEHEHTPDDDIAAEIARDHLMEHPFYYDFLEDMEKEMEGDYDEKEYGKKERAEEEESEDKKVEDRKNDSEDPMKKARLKKLFG